MSSLLPSPVLDFFISLCIRHPVHSSIRPFISYPSIFPSISPSDHSSIQPSVQLLILPYGQLYICIHPFIHPHHSSFHTSNHLSIFIYMYSPMSPFCPSLAHHSGLYLHTL